MYALEPVYYLPTALQARFRIRDSQWPCQVATRQCTTVAAGRAWYMAPRVLSVVPAGVNHAGREPRHKPHKICYRTVHERSTHDCSAPCIYCIPCCTTSHDPVHLVEYRKHPNHSTRKRKARAHEMQPTPLAQQHLCLPQIAPISTQSLTLSPQTKKRVIRRHHKDPRKRYHRNCHRSSQQQSLPRFAHHPSSVRCEAIKGACGDGHGWHDAVTVVVRADELVIELGG